MSHKEGQEEWEALQESQEWLGGPSGGPAVVGRPSQRARRGQQAYLVGRKGLGGLGGFGRPFWRARRHQEAHPEGREGLGGFRRASQRTWKSWVVLP